MTLVQSAGFGNVYTIMTTDQRRVRVFEDDPQNAIIESNNEIKVEYLTDFVMIGHAGWVDLTDYLKEELKQRVSPSDDLGKCKMALTDLIAEIKSDKDSELYEWITTPGNGALMLNGFYANGETGQVTYNEAQKGISELKITFDKPDSLFAGCLPPTDEVAKKNFLFDYILSMRQYDIETVLKAAFQVHGFIAYFHDIAVSSELKYFCLINDNGIIRKFSGEYDTKELFPMIEKRSEKIKELVL